MSIENSKDLYLKCAEYFLKALHFYSYLYKKQKITMIGVWVFPERDSIRLAIHHTISDIDKYEKWKEKCIADFDLSEDNQRLRLIRCIINHDYIQENYGQFLQKVALEVETGIRNGNYNCNCEVLIGYISEDKEFDVLCRFDYEKEFVFEQEILQTAPENVYLQSEEDFSLEFYLMIFCKWEFLSEATILTLIDIYNDRPTKYKFDCLLELFLKKERTENLIALIIDAITNKDYAVEILEDGFVLRVIREKNFLVIHSQEVTIPESIVSIRRNEFYLCRNITYVAFRKVFFLL